MTRKRMMDDQLPAAEDRSEPRESASPRTTIVGGQPRAGAEEVPPVPTGIQSLLRLAAVDEAFREQLVARRGAVAEAVRLELTSSEQAILRAIPEDQLRQMAEQLPPPPPARRAFLRQTAATAVVLLGGAAMAQTLEACCGTLAGEDPIGRPEHNEMEVEGGASPHWDEEPTPEAITEEPTPERPDHNEMQETGGAAPDWPEEPTPVEAITPPKSPSRGISHDMPPPKESGKPGGSG